MMAIVDVLDFLPADHKDRPAIINILRELSASIEKFRDPQTGMWYQVTDLGQKEGNYLESTGSIMFIYTWIKGAQKGHLGSSYLEKGEKAYDQFIKHFVKTETDGFLSITDCCSVARFVGDKNYREGRLEYYISEHVRDNDPKAIGPFIMTRVLLDR